MVGVRITDDAIIAAAQLSNRYINERFLPDKAIDVMDEAASHLRMQSDSKPAELDSLDRQILQLKIEQAALTREKDNPASAKRLEKLAGELTGLEAKSAEQTKSWEQVKNLSAAEVKGLQLRLEEARHRLEVSQRQGELEKAAELSYAIIPGLEQEVEAAKQAGRK